MKRALILGINGQDGSYLAEILLDKGYDVHGIVRRNSQPNLWRINHLLENLTLHQGDLLDFSSINNVFWKILPEEIYNEADQDHVGFSQATPSYSAAVTYGAVANLLELVDRVKQPKIKLFQPLSATMFGNALVSPQDTSSEFNPETPYAIAKTAVHYLCEMYRKKGTFVSTAIMYNHDSVRRQGDYLLHKICKAAVAINRGSDKKLSLTNCNMRVDIGCAREFMEGAYRLIQLDRPEHILLGTGVANDLYSFVKCAFSKARAVMGGFEGTPGAGNSLLLADMDPTKDLLNWCPQRSVYEIINDLVDRYDYIEGK